MELPPPVSAQNVNTSSSTKTAGLAGVLKRGNNEQWPASALNADDSRFGRNTVHNRDSGDGGPGGRHRPGLQFSRQPWTLSWTKIKRRLLLASTGTPSSGEGRSESSQTSADSGQQLANAYALHGKGGTTDRRVNGATGPGDEGKQVHIDDEEDWQVDQLVVDSEFWDEDGNFIAQPGMYGSTSSHRHERMSASGWENTTVHSDAGSVVNGPTWRAIDGIVTLFGGWIFPKVENCKASKASFKLTRANTSASAIISSSLASATRRKRGFSARNDGITLNEMPGSVPASSLPI